MANGYDLKYLPPKKGDEWKPETLVGALEKTDKLSRLNHRSAKDLETLMGEYISPELGNFDVERREAVVKGYQGLVNNSIGDYVIGNLKGAVDYAGQGKVLQIAANLPYQARKAQGETPLSESDQKYNEIAKAADKLRKMSEAVQQEGGVQKELDAEFEGVNEHSKAFWLNALGPKEIIQYRLQKAERKLLKAITDYGVVNYIKDAIAISDKAEKDFNKERKELEDKQKSELEGKMNAGPMSPMEEAKLTDKYSAQFAEVEKKYQSLRGARQLLINGHGEQMPGLISLVNGRFQQEKKKKEEAEARQRAQAEAGDRK
jgi:hypothetical protein